MSTPYTYLPNFVTDPDGAFARLWAELAWERRPGTPRREYYSNDLGVPYAYGRGAGQREYLPQPWHPDMLAIRRALEAHTGVRFEVCFVNGYEDQSDFLGWHADDSKEMDDERPIAVVSLGAERELWFRANQSVHASHCHVCKVGVGELHTEFCSVALGAFTKEQARALPLEQPVDKQKLGHGSLCLMHAGMQDTHQHRIPKAGFICGARVSLTFRGYVAPDGAE